MKSVEKIEAGVAALKADLQRQEEERARAEEALVRSSAAAAAAHQVSLSVY